MSSEGAELVFVDSVAEVENMLRWLGERRPVLAFDTETEGLDPWRDKIRLVQFGDAKTGWALPYRDWRGVVRHVLETYEGPMVGWNPKFDVSLLEQDGLVVPRSQIHDGMVMAHLADSHGPKALKSASKRYVGAGADRGQMLLKAAFKKQRWDWATVPLDFEVYHQYAALDTVLTARTAESLWKQIQPYREAYEQEMAVTWVLLDMEQRGARVDVPYCDKMNEELLGELGEIRDRWPDLNILSSTQVMDVLKAAGFEFTKRTEKGNLALDEEVLAGIDHPLAADALRARKCDKWTSSYFGAYLRLEVDGIVHCNVNPLGAEKTGRMSISRPSMQNIPRLKMVRDAIIPREGNKLVLCDYATQETRLIAHFARETAMIEAFRNGVDIHNFVATMIYSTPSEDVTPVQRFRAKTCGHARNYGAKADRLAAAAGISLTEGREFARRYDKAFPGIHVFNSKVIRLVRERDEGGYGYVTSYGGRKIRVPVAHPYVGVNWLIQGSGSDVLKKGLVNLDRMGIAQFAILPVHDETVFDIPTDSIEELLPMIHEAFEHKDISVPLPVETKIVDSWGQGYA